MPIHSSPDAKEALRLPAIPRRIWALGFVSLFMDVSSEMIHSVLPIFLVARPFLVLRAGNVGLGHDYLPLVFHS